MRNRNSLIRERREAFRDARLIVIASEGKDTERIYFKALAKEYTNPRVHVHILERSVDEQNNSSPEHVLKHLNDYKSQYELEADDELWLVVDKDRWTEAMTIRRASRNASRRSRIKLFLLRIVPINIIQFAKERNRSIATIQITFLHISPRLILAE